MRDMPPFPLPPDWRESDPQGLGAAPDPAAAAGSLGAAPVPAADRSTGSLQKGSRARVRASRRQVLSNGSVAPTSGLAKRTGGYSTEARDDIVDGVCELLLMGKTLDSILATEPWAPTAKSFMRWLAEDPILKERYYTAREVGADIMAGQTVTLMDDATAADLELRKERAQARRWFVSRIAPGTYAERRKIEQSTDANVNVQTVQQIDVSGLSMAELKLLETAFSKVIELTPGEAVEEGDDSAPPSA